MQLPENAFREIFRFAELGKDDTFYHLGCGDGKGISIALEEFCVKNATGIDNDEKKINLAKKLPQEKNLSNYTLQCNDIRQADFDDATVILFWFADQKIIDEMMDKFSSSKNGF